MFYTIRAKLTFAFLLVAIAAIGLLGFCLSNWAEQHYIAALTEGYLSDSLLISHAVLPAMGDPGAVRRLAEQMGRDLNAKVTVFRLDGSVVGESNSDIPTIGAAEDQPEVQRAIESGSGSAIRYSAQNEARMLFVASRVGTEDRTLGVARIAISLDQVDRTRETINRAFLVGAMIAAVFAGLAGAWVAGRIGSRINAMNALARGLAKGELEHRVTVPTGPHDEIDDLAATLNASAAELRRMVNELENEKGKLQTILDRTDDGIMVVDRESRVRMSNPAAASYLQTTPEQIRDKTIIESTFSHDLSKLVERVLSTGNAGSLEIELTEWEPIYLNVYVAPLGEAGVIVVMHDQTAIKRTDVLRRDFVANVSHELRTPLASIKAMAETLVLRGKNSPRIVDDFAGKIMSEADRLAALSTDLLDLATIEEGRRLLRTEVFPLSVVAAKALSGLEGKAADKGIEVTADLPAGLKVNADTDSVYQILVNLVDNAIRYTPRDGHITISAKEKPDRVAVMVSDTGTGIPTADLPRVFERFYRVDKARSRDSGGTGLGLAIVKHLVEVHGGSVTVESRLGEGTTFTFTMPLPPM